jgi:hypothetical protein
MPYKAVSLRGDIGSLESSPGASTPGNHGLSMTI